MRIADIDKDEDTDNDTGDNVDRSDLDEREDEDKEVGDDDDDDNDEFRRWEASPPHCSYSTEKGGGSGGMDAVSRGCSRACDGGEGDDGGNRRDKRRGQHGINVSEWNMSSV